jgi:hypothetical protein
MARKIVKNLFSEKSREERIEDLVKVATRLASSNNQLPYNMDKVLVDSSLILELRIVLKGLKTEKVV